MAYGDFVAFTMTIPSNATTANILDLGVNFSKVYIDPSGAGAQLTFFAAPSSAGTLRKVYLDPSPNTATVQTASWTVATAMSGGLQAGPSGLRFLSVALTATAANGTTVTIYGSNP